MLSHGVVPVTWTPEETTGFAVQLADQPGTLGELAQRLGKENINVRGFAVVPGEDGAGGSAYIVTDDPENTADVLETSGYTVEKLPAILVQVADHPGELARVAACLARNGVRLDAAFVTGDSEGNQLECAFAVDRPEPAMAALTAAPQP